MTTTLRSLRTGLASVRPYFAGSFWAFVVSATGAAIAGACEGALAWIMKPLVDQGLQRPDASIWAIPALIVLLFVLRGAAGFVSNYALAWAANGATLRMRQRMFQSLLVAHPAIFAARTSSSLINTVVYEVQHGVGSLVGAVQTLLKDSFTVIALLGLLLYLNWTLTLFMLILIPGVGVAMRVFGRRMHRITRESQGAVDRLAYIVEENVLAWRTVRLHGAEAHQRGRFEGASTALRRLMLKSTVASSVITPVTQVITAIALAAMVGVALWQSQSGRMTVGAFVAFITAAVAVATPLRRLTDVFGPVAGGLAAVQRGVDLIEHAPKEAGGTHAPGRAHGEIGLSGVTVRFGGDRLALDRIDLHIDAGQTVAIVGPSGAGKTTLVNLLPRFLDPTAGRLVLDGVPLEAWQLTALREQFAYVSQEVVLFNDSVLANVCFGSAIDRERAREALLAANLGGFVDGLADGIDTLVGHNGAELSGGQRQRLAIARALYKDAPILLLDEATSALDTASERLVQGAIDRLLKGRTSIVVAHRLSTIERADRIVVLDGGRVVEQGSHAALLARGGVYARLHTLQFGHSQASLV